MSYCLTAEEMRSIDEFTINAMGVGGAVLMERAALKCRDRIMEALSGDDGICILLGRGNNAGDGLALGRIMALEGRKVSAIWALDSRMSELCAAQLDSALKAGLRIIDEEEFDILLAHSDTVFVDAIFGIGLKREIEGRSAELIERLNASGRRVYAVDIPSGISADTGEVLGTAVKADVTVTFGFMKRGLLMYPGAEYVGRVYVEDAGFAVNGRNFAAILAGSDELHAQIRDRLKGAVTYFADLKEAALPRRYPAGNKGSYGKLLIIGGYRGYAGAAYLAAHAALTSGAGMVRVLTSPDTVALLNARQPEAMTGILFREDGSPDEKLLEEALRWSTVVLIGPGLGRSEAAAAAADIVFKSGKPLVIDADALNLLSLKADSLQATEGPGQTAEAGTDSQTAAGSGSREDAGSLRRIDVRSDRAAIIAGLIKGPAVLTPHMGELSRLTGINTADLKRRVFDTALDYTYNNNLIYVCKDARTLVAADGHLHLNVNGNSGMSTAGAGDVLAGLTAGFLAAGLSPFEAARSAAAIHAMAGDRAADELCGDCITADMLAERLAGCISSLRREKSGH